MDLDIHCIELIPQRNRMEIMEPFVRYFYEKGFIVTFGTEHNAPGLIPLTPHCSGNIPLTDFLLQVNYEGACTVAAHQYLQTQGFNDENGKDPAARRTELTELGDRVIRKELGM